MLCAGLRQARPRAPEASAMSFRHVVDFPYSPAELAALFEAGHAPIVAPEWRHQQGTVYITAWDRRYQPFERMGQLRLPRCADAAAVAHRGRRLVYPGGPPPGARLPGAAGPRPGEAWEPTTGTMHATTEHSVTAGPWALPRACLVDSHRSHRDVLRGRCPPAFARDRRRRCQQTRGRSKPSGGDGRPHGRPV
jgi:hypothetical protein